MKRINIDLRFDAVISRLLLFSCFMYCSNAINARTLELKISNTVVNSDFIGIGVEWDPYDEAELWGSGISDEDWAKLYKRLDFMRPQYIRCMINSPFRYYDSENGSYNKTRNIESVSRLLQYCTDRNITVVFGEYNPPTFEKKQSQEWIDMSVDYLNYLVCERGFTCIKHFVIFNEPDGDWSATNGDYNMWKETLKRFHQKMTEYPGLLDKVSLAGPDVVAKYKNPNSEYDSVGWVNHTVSDVDDIIGLYDIHSYPGQHEVRMGEYAHVLSDFRQSVPQTKKIVLGESGFKYNQPEDSVLMAVYKQRLENHPFTKGSDCNMLCYDFFYGLDMPVLAIEAMNNGFSGIALWMLDDAMHSNGDSGKPEDLKIWGLWNILGEEVFNKPDEEEIRPLYYTWSLMCRYFPKGINIVKTTRTVDDGIFAVAGRYNGKYTIALVNISDTDKYVKMSFAEPIKNVAKYVYKENHLNVDKNGFPLPVETGFRLKNRKKTLVPAQSFILFTNLL